MLSGTSTAGGAAPFSPASPNGRSFKPDRLLNLRRAEQRQLNQRAAVEFIESVLGEKLPTDDLHAALQDGAVLCRVVNSLRPTTIRRVVAPNAPFAKMENINSFLTAARELGVPDSDLFQTVDLYEGKNMYRVVSAVLGVSRVVAGIPVGRRRAPTLIRALPDKWASGDSHTAHPLSSPSSPPRNDSARPSRSTVSLGIISTSATTATASTDTLIAEPPLRPPGRLRDITPTGSTRSREGTLVGRPALTVRTQSLNVDSLPMDADAPQSAPVANRTPDASPARSSKHRFRPQRGDDGGRNSTPGRPCQSAGVDEPRETLTLYEDDSDGESGRSTQYQLGNCIGKGQFGAVYRSLNLDTGQMVAIKRITLDHQMAEHTDDIMREVELLRSLQHPRVVRYEGFIKTPQHLNIVMEYVENGSLYHTLRAFGAFPEKLVLAYMVKIIEGLVYLHENQVVHCDLKAANILTTKKGNTKLSDFGVSLNLKLVEPRDDPASKSGGAAAVDSEVAGTPNWMAPEIIELKGASTASDIWSLGCTVIELLTGRPPYADLMPMTALFRIVEDDHPPLPDGISATLREFLLYCFDKDPTRRPTAPELMKLPWITGYSRHKKELTSLRRKHSVHIARHVSQLHAAAPLDTFPVDPEGTVRRRGNRRHSSRRTSGLTVSGISQGDSPGTAAGMTRLGSRLLLRSPLRPTQTKLQEIRRHMSQSYKKPSFRRFNLRARRQLREGLRNLPLSPFHRDMAVGLRDVPPSSATEAVTNLTSARNLGLSDLKGHLALTPSPPRPRPHRLSAFGFTPLPATSPPATRGRIPRSGRRRWRKSQARLRQSLMCPVEPEVAIEVHSPPISTAAVTPSSEPRDEPIYPVASAPAAVQSSDPTSPNASTGSLSRSPAGHRFLATVVDRDTMCGWCRRILLTKVVACQRCDLACHIECRSRLPVQCPIALPPTTSGPPPPVRRAGTQPSVPRDNTKMPPPPLSRHDTDSNVLSSPAIFTGALASVDPDAEAVRSDPAPTTPSRSALTLRPEPSSPLGGQPGTFRCSPIRSVPTAPAFTTGDASAPSMASLPSESANSFPTRRASRHETQPTLSSSSLRLGDEFLADWVDIDASQVDILPSEDYPADYRPSIRLGTPKSSTKPRASTMLHIPAYPYYGLDPTPRKSQLGEPSRPTTGTATGPPKYLGMTPRVAVNGSFMRDSTASQSHGSGSPNSTPSSSPSASASRLPHTPSNHATSAGDNLLPMGATTVASTARLSSVTDRTSMNTLNTATTTTIRSRLFTRPRPSSWSRKPVFKSPTVLRAEENYYGTIESVFDDTTDVGGCVGADGKRVDTAGHLDTSWDSGYGGGGSGGTPSWPRNDATSSKDGRYTSMASVVGVASLYPSKPTGPRQRAVTSVVTTPGSSTGGPPFLPWGAGAHTTAYDASNPTISTSHTTSTTNCHAGPRSAVDRLTRDYDFNDPSASATVHRSRSFHSPSSSASGTRTAHQFQRCFPIPSAAAAALSVLTPSSRNGTPNHHHQHGTSAATSRHRNSLAGPAESPYATLLPSTVSTANSPFWCPPRLAAQGADKRKPKKTKEDDCSVM
ncbi:Protein kinase of the Mitotic Exit Network [Tieghemiomyces parasiticus]|uniref:Protein kinase of the Mitotic Exit Network n=1 Tax=Tieghemiomyces parasiticus TaxID=78921 RepID=A0A9W7ZUZ7_9FUNG|nr:Protein kinase of the Mitotic Exit Network [Tieghemiomyces parasiticus]